MPMEMRYLSLSKFVEIENEFLGEKEDRIKAILELLKKEKKIKGGSQKHTVAALRRLPSSSKYRRQARQADCEYF